MRKKELLLGGQMEQHKTIIALLIGAFLLITSWEVLAEPGNSQGPAVYLFLNERDQDSGCQSMYSVYESGKKKLPKGVKTGRLDVNDSKNESIFKKFDVRLLPTVLFLNKKGEVTKKVMGEGSEVEDQLLAAFKKADELLK